MQEQLKIIGIYQEFDSEKNSNDVQKEFLSLQL